MKKISVKDFIKNIDEYLSRVSKKEKPLKLKYKGSNYILLSEQDYKSIQETIYLLSNSANSKSLEKSIKQMKKGQLKKFKT